MLSDNQSMISSAMLPASNADFLAFILSDLMNYDVLLVVLDNGIVQ